MAEKTNQLAGRRDKAGRLRRVRLGLVWLALLAVFHVPLVAYAQGDAPRYRVGLFQNLPLSYLHEDGHAEGIFPELLGEIALREGWELEWVRDSWAGCLARLESGDIDLMISIFNTPERDRVFDFSSEPVLTAWGQVFTKPGAAVDDIRDLEGKRIAVMNGDVSNAAYWALCEWTDMQIGIVLDELGVRDDFVVHYTSDHGEMAGERGLWGKHCFYDESVRVPLVLSGPGLTLRDENGTIRASLSGYEYFPSLMLRDENGTPRAELSVGQNVNQHLILSDEDGTTPASLRLMGLRGSSLTLWDEDGATRAWLSGDKDAPGLSLSDENETIRAWLFLMDKFGAGLTLLDENGRDRASLDVLMGRPTLTLLDAEGRDIWSAP